MSDERRTEERRGINREFSSIAHLVSDHMTNISRSGVFIRSDDPLPMGTRVTLRFDVMVEDQIRTIEGTGEVVRVCPQGGTEPAGMGLMFLDLSRGSRELIERILSEA